MDRKKKVIKNDNYDHFPGEKELINSIINKIKIIADYYKIKYS